MTSQDPGPILGAVLSAAEDSAVMLAIKGHTELASFKEDNTEALGACLQDWCGCSV